MLQDESACIFEADPYSIGIVYGVSSVGDDVNQFTFSTEVRATIAQSVPNPRTLHTAVNAREEQKGYSLGGYDIYAPVYLNSIDGWSFVTSTVFTTAITTSASVQSAGGSESSTKGYAFCGSRTGADDVIEAIIFATETNSAVAAVADTAANSFASMNSAADGVFAGGAASGNIDVIQKLSHSTEVASTSASTLSIAKAYAGGTESGPSGYIMGGQTSVYISTVETYSFSSEAVATSAATLNDTRGVYDSTLSSKLKGYSIGGYDGALKSEIDGIDFVTGTSINPSAVLSATSRGAACFTS